MYTFNGVITYRGHLKTHKNYDNINTSINHSFIVSPSNLPLLFLSSRSSGGPTTTWTPSPSARTTGSASSTRRTVQRARRAGCASASWWECPSRALDTGGAPTGSRYTACYRSSSKPLSRNHPPGCRSPRTSRRRSLRISSLDSRDRGPKKSWLSSASTSTKLTAPDPQTRTEADHHPN